MGARALTRVLGYFLGGCLACASLHQTCLAEEMPGDAGFAAANRALGHSDPVLAFNLASVSDWSPQMPFLDLMKMSRPWIGHLPGQWGGQDTGALRDRGLLDSDGWPLRIPADLDRIGTIFAWNNQPLAAESRQGIYVLTYSGEGALRLGKDARVLDATPGRIVFRNTTGAQFTLDIMATDPEGTGDYIRDISIVREEHRDYFEAGALFNPDWVALIADARQVRFMDWMRTNGSTLTEWEDRPQVDDVTWSTGVPLETMTALANQLGVDPWFTLPHGASVEFVRAFAGQVRDHLDPRLKAHVEFSNETWNLAFRQVHDLADRAQADWGVRDATAQYLKQATRVARIWDDVFGAGAETRLVKVLAGQTVNSWLTERLLTGKAWSDAEPGEATAPRDVFDAFAVATYFGGMEVRSPDFRMDLLSAINAPDVDAEAWLYDRLRDPAHPGALAHVFASLARQRALASLHGLGLIAYEGGQHVHQALPRDTPLDDRAVLQQFLAEFVRSDRMALLYADLWAFWMRVGDGPFMHYVDVSVPGAAGSWGAVAALQDTTPRSAFMATTNQTSRQWWEEERAVGTFLHGRYHAGDEGDNLIFGTAEEDYLAGKGGDDTFIPGRGDDGIHGGDGWDIARFDGPSTAYHVKTTESGLRVVGPDGDDFLVEVEEIIFSDGKRLRSGDPGRDAAPNRARVDTGG